MKELFKYNECLTIEELKKKRKIFRELAWVNLIYGIIVLIVTLFQYIIIGYIGLTVILMGTFILSVILGLHSKDCEANCSLHIELRKHNLLKGE